MAVPISINLLKTHTTKPQEVVKLEKNLKPISLVSIIILTVFGIITLLTNLLINSQTKKLNLEKNNLVSQINAQKTKEGLFLSVKNRINETGNLYNNLPPIEKMYTLVVSIAPPPVLTNLSIKYDGEITMTVSLAGLEDVTVVVERISELGAQGALKNPKLTNLSYAPDKGYTLNFSFNAGNINL